MRRHLKRYLSVLGLALALPLIALATFEFQKIDRPLPYIATLPSGINDAGWIVGTASTIKQKAFGTEEGFLLREGQYEKIFYTGARDTDLGGINDQGEIVGTYGDFSFKDHCFLRDQSGYYASFDMPSMFSNATIPDCNGINQGGDTVGSYSDGSTNHGWWRTAGGTFYQLDVSFGGASNTEAWGINKGRDIVGSYYQAASRHGFLFRSGSYYPVDFPGATNTHAFGINDRGDIVGSYSTSTTDHGFLWREGQWKTVDVNLSDALVTNRVSGINNHGCMVGVYTGTDGRRHGFEASAREADGDGYEPGKNGGTAYMHFHEDDCNQKPETEDFSDPGSGIDFHSTQVTAVTYDDVAHTVTIAGLGTNNSLLPVAFTIIGVDSTAVPPGMFSITMSNGYSNSGSLLSGTITLR